MFYEVIPTKIFGKGEVLTYQSDTLLAPGQIVKIPLGRQTIVGVVDKKVVQPDFACKKITEILYSTPLPKHLLKAVHFVAEYYLVPLPVALSLALPVGLQKKRRKTLKQERVEDFIAAKVATREAAKETETKEVAKEAAIFTLQKTEQNSAVPEIPLNEAQKKAIEALSEASGATKLLLGVTGSGKTNIYLHEASRALQGQKSVILLVPEIALTGQLVRVFSQYFGDKIVLMHSGQTEAERHRIFESLLTETSSPAIEMAKVLGETSSPAMEMAKETGPKGLEKRLKQDRAASPKIVIGPRSALFAPLQNLGLIIIDEAHEATYAQENTPKYSALRVASLMAKTLTIPCILGSATPNLVDFYLAKKLNSLVLLTEKAKKTAITPKISIIDFKNRENFGKNRYFSTRLLEAISRNLETGQQTLIFHNRRGSSPLTICEHCGNEIVCPNCFLPLTLHSDSYNLICHTCNFTMPVPTVCPNCDTAGELVHKGFGTKLLESELSRLFREARIRRFDGDTRKGETLESVYDEVLNGGVDILIGTQTLAKGLDLPKLATVGVVQADAGLSLPDFSAEERTFELLTQVIGRVGRGHLETAEAIIQTFQPDHPVLRYAMSADYLGFSEYLLKRRAAAKFPPFTFILKCEITLKTEALVVSKIQKAYRMLSSRPGLIVSPPLPAFHEHTARGYTWEILVRARSRAQLLKVAQALASLDANFRLTLDPPSLL